MRPETRIPYPFRTGITGLGAPQARPAGAERGEGVPASDGDGGAGGAKSPGLVDGFRGLSASDTPRRLILIPRAEGVIADG
jgi:hypothetical protein